jgi:hypothetical protein
MPELPPKWLLLAADLLDMAASEFARHGCNDLPIPDGWTDAEVEAFGRAFEEMNSGGRDFDPEIPWVPDFAAMGFLADMLRGVANA